MKQISPMMKTTIMSTRTNGASVKKGCSRRNMIKLTNKMLATKSNPNPVA